MLARRALKSSHIHLTCGRMTGEYYTFSCPRRTTFIWSASKDSHETETLYENVNDFYLVRANVKMLFPVGVTVVKKTSPSVSVPKEIIGETDLPNL